MSIFCKFYHYCSLWCSQLGKVNNDFCPLAAWMASSGTMKSTQQGEASRSLEHQLVFQQLVPRAS
ncbi:olfactory receptor 59, isoform CRA_a [Rattus norvegicus]|uniref:Olfactory receptor 59, isoform CRA_a n=1 Tax=Rattus norvegicus TaxID=10116 RepID=A6I764_RAT|nr:olfactory receptor 59, isoform CRA_a [Rattus norvegicus]